MNFSRVKYNILRKSPPTGGRWSVYPYKDQFSDLTKTFICPKCSTAYLCFTSSDIILYSNAGSNGWRIYGVLEEDEALDRICDCQ